MQEFVTLLRKRSLSLSYTNALRPQGEAIEAHVPDAHLLVRKKLHKWQGSNLFRSAIAYALALDRIVPEDQRRVTNNARPRNTTTVPAFTDAQLSDPLTPEVSLSEPGR